MKRTVLYPVHRDLKARLVEFGGFEMPVQYHSIVQEHRAVRERAGLFDLSHMGRFEVRGSEAVAGVDHLVTHHVARMETGQVRYALVLNEEGGVLDDVLVYRLVDSLLLVVNASNRDKLLPWFQEHLQEYDAHLEDRSEELAMVAIQGPDAVDMLAPHLRPASVKNLRDLGYYRISEAGMELAGCEFEGWVSRTGYTGEDGFEIYLPSERAIPFWHTLKEVFGEQLMPCGLGARDTLRLEAGMPLYGHELGEDINPLEAGLQFAIRFKKPDGFIGIEALLGVRERGVTRQLRGFVVEGKRVARSGMPIFHGSEPAGEITSGAPSPTLGCNIAMALVPAELPEQTPLEVQIRRIRAPLRPHPLPFYRRERS
ncbi:MAG: glycine cleavage system aminomethyltransferase GcvT [Planctomycetota bacterium]